MAIRAYMTGIGKWMNKSISPKVVYESLLMVALILPFSMLEMLFASQSGSRQHLQSMESTSNAIGSWLMAKARVEVWNSASLSLSP